MFLDRYWSHITKFPFHGLGQILIPYARFNKKSQTDLQDLSGTAVSDFFLVFQDVTISDHNTFQSIVVSPKLKLIGFGSHAHVPKSENHEHEEF